MLFIILYIPCHNEVEAKTIGELLLRARLIACANYVPIESVYWWQGAITENGEILILAKTRADLYDRVVALVEQHHSYEIPCVAAWRIECLNKKYASWLEGELGDVSWLT